MSLERVPPKTPVLDAAESAGGRVGVIATLLRPFREWAAARKRARDQAYIDRTHHDALRVGQPEREDVP